MYTRYRSPVDILKRSYPSLVIDPHSYDRWGRGGNNPALSGLSTPAFRAPKASYPEHSTLSCRSIRQTQLMSVAESISQRVTAVFITVTLGPHERPACDESCERQAIVCSV